MKPITPLPGFNASPLLCNICRGPAEVSWPVRNSPHCRACVDKARAHVAESAERFPKFGTLAEDLLDAARAAFLIGGRS